jgi:hypothetical protein
MTTTVIRHRDSRTVIWLVLIGVLAVILLSILPFSLFLQLGSRLNLFATVFLGIFIKALPYLLIGTLISGLVAEGLWLMDAGSLGGQMIAEQPDYIYSNPQWDPWGKALIFQQFNFKGKHESEICLWMPGWEESQILTQGILPRWLP